MLMKQEIATELVKASPPVGASVLTMDVVVVSLTMIYLILQIISLVRRHYVFEKDREDDS